MVCIQNHNPQAIFQMNASFIWQLGKFKAYLKKTEA